VEESDVHFGAKIWFQRGQCRAKRKQASKQTNKQRKKGFPPLPNANSYLSPKTFTVVIRVHSPISSFYTQTVGMYWSQCVVSASNSPATYLQKRDKFNDLSTCNHNFDAHQHSKRAVISQVLCILAVMFLYSYCLYALFCIFCFHRANWHSPTTLTEVFSVLFAQL
jgi:hypothetical protein